MNTGKLFLGILAGVATGLLLAITFGPHEKAPLLRKLPEKEKDFRKA